MSATRLTHRRLCAIEAAVSAMLAGCRGEGDWPEEITHADLDRAHDWACEQIARHAKKQGSD